MVIFTLGQIELLEAALLLLPALTALIYKEKCLWAILATAGACVILGGLFMLVGRPKNRVIYAKEGFVIVALAWIVMSALGAVPFVLSGEIPNYIDAFFETVSGFTTTGASILTNVEAMSRGLLFWRSFTHWIGGMGVLVFIMAIVPNVSERSIHIIRAEMPGHCAHAGRHADGVLKQVLLSGGGCQKFFGTGQSEFFHGEFPSF